MNIKKVLQKRDSSANKGTYKKTLIIGGSLSYIGSILLASEGALRSGVGYVTLGVRKEIYPYVAGKIEEVTYKILENGYEDIYDTYSSIVFGNGIEKDEFSKKLLSDILSNYEKRLIIDASGLDLLKEIGLDVLKNSKAQIIVTPHMGEFTRLFEIDMKNKTPKEKENELIKLANEYKVVIVLKDAESLISEGKHIYKIKCGNAGLAKAGSGDVLAGLLGGLCAFSTASTYEISCVGHEIFSCAADRLKEKLSLHSFKASEVAYEIGIYLKEKKY